MSAKRILVTLLLCAIVISLTILAKIFILTPGPQVGSLQVYSLPKAKVYLNNQEVGTTPFTAEKITPGEYQIKLIVSDVVWETKVPVVSGALTFINREIGPSLELSSGQILTMERIPVTKAAELAVISDPGQTIVTIDGIEKGKSSSLIKNLSPGEKVVVISATGYADQVISAMFAPGFRLNAVVKLHLLNYQPLVETKPVVEQIASQSAKVAETPTGFLRIRSASSSSALEIGRVNSGQTLTIETKASGWVKIKWEEKEGWVSDQYLIFQ